jgi:hypothetical protein
MLVNTDHQSTIDLQNSPRMNHKHQIILQSTSRMLQYNNNVIDKSSKKFNHDGKIIVQHIPKLVQIQFAQFLNDLLEYASELTYFAINAFQTSSLRRVQINTLVK